MRWCIDRFAGDYAVLESEEGERADFARAMLPEDCSEGDWLSFDGGSFSKDTAYTESARERISEKMKKLFR